MILVTGGAGFLGSHLVDLLVAGGESVRVLEREGVRAEHLPREVEVVRGDIRVRAEAARAARSCRRVYHLAGNPNLWCHDRAEFERVNHDGARNVLEESLEAGAERVLHVSTESILFAEPGHDGVPVESLRPRDEEMVGTYCLSKLRGERVAFELAARGAPVVVAAPTVLVGPGDRNLTPPTRMTVAFCRGKLPAYLDCRFNLADARDVAQGLIAVMDSAVPGTRYLIGGTNTRLLSWLQVVGKVLDRRAPRFRVPYWAALATAHIQELWADHVSHTMPLGTVTGVKLARRDMHFDGAASRSALRYSVRPVERSAEDAVAFYREMGWIG